MITATKTKDNNKNAATNLVSALFHITYCNTDSINMKKQKSSVRISLEVKKSQQQQQQTLQHKLRGDMNKNMHTFLNTHLHVSVAAPLLPWKQWCDEAPVDYYV